MNCKKTKSIVRFASIICALTLCFTFLVGCNNETAEELEKLKNDFSDINKELEAIKEEYEKLLQENATLSEANNAATQEIASLNGKKEEAVQKIDTLENDNDLAKQEIESLKTGNEALKQELESLKSENEAALDELESIKDQLNDLIDNMTPDPSDEKIRIYIDQGHNPTFHHNSGASGNDLHEEDLTFTIGQLLAGLLAIDGRFEVCLSRPTASTVLGTDNSSSLEARVNGAKEFEADYFISLHVNAHSAESANGIEIWVSELSGEAYDLGNFVRAGLVASTGLRDRGMKKDETPLYVLKNATMPAILVEMGFITNQQDSALLDQSPNLFAQGIYNGILAYFKFQ